MKIDSYDLVKVAVVVFIGVMAYQGKVSVEWASGAVIITLLLL